MRRATYALGLLLIMLSGASACRSDCLQFAVPPIVVTVVDDATGGRPATEVAVRIVKGTTETIPPRSFTVDSTLQFIGPVDGPGVFEVIVSADGYREFRQSAISVGEDNCGNTEQVRLAVRLQPLPHSSLRSRL
jgi:hypothetical protein